MIFSELSPNTQKDDFQIVLSRIIRPGRYLEGDYTGKVNDWFKQHLGAENVFSYDSGRSALYAILKGFGIEKVKGLNLVPKPPAIITTFIFQT